MKTVYDGRDLEALSFAKNYYDWILDEFRPFLGQDVVEVGSGTGNFSRWLLDRAPRSFAGIEPSANMFPLLQANVGGRGNVRLHNAYFRDVCRALDPKPDTILYINVLEHVPDDRGELEAVCETLKPGGHLCLFVPALQQLYGAFDATVKHERRYHKKPLEALVRAAGFELVRSTYFDFAGIVPWWVAFCLLRRPMLLSGNVTVYDRWVVPVTRALEQRLRPPVGKNLLVVARKP